MEFAPRSGDIPKGWVALEGGFERWRSGDRPASLSGVFAAEFHPDGTLFRYACLQPGLDIDGLALRLEAGRTKGWCSAGGLTEFYEDGRFYSVANGHEEGEASYRPMGWEEWVRRAIADIHREAATSRERERRRKEGLPLWQRPDGTFVDP